MSDDRLSRIEETLQVLVGGRQEVRSELDGLRDGLADVRTGLADVQTGLADVRTGLADAQTGLADVQTGLVDVRAGLADVQTGLADVRAGLAEQHHQMLVLHEETLDSIRALAFDPAPLRREFQAADASQREEINQRLEPIETFIRTRTRRRR